MDANGERRGEFGFRQAAPWLVALAVFLLTFFFLPALVGRISYARTAAQVRALREGMGGLERGDTLSTLFQAVAEAVKPAVVVIRTSERVRVEPEPDMRDFLRRFFGEEGFNGFSGPKYYFKEGIGSGIIVDAENGYVLTNWHVVHKAQTAEVILADGRVRQGRWAKSDQKNDLAIVKIRPGGLMAAPLGDSDEVKVGDWVLAIGAPEGLPQTVTSGIISALGRSTAGGHESFLQTDAAINPGNSGGPLVNMAGHVIGINTAIISPVGVNAGIGLAIPSNVARKTIRQLTDSASSTAEGDGEADEAELITKQFSP
jgi:S1-C subfamily serine protease